MRCAWPPKRLTLVGNDAGAKTRALRLETTCEQKVRLAPVCPRPMQFPLPIYANIFQKLRSLPVRFASIGCRFRIAASLVSLALPLALRAGAEEPWPDGMVQFVQTTITDRNGLPQDSINALTQTTDGYLWFGTEEGLARFDGIRITVYDTQHFPGLKDNFIYALTPGRDGSLWIGTRSGVVRLKNGVFDTKLSAKSTIAAMLESKDGAIWVGGLDGLYRIKDDRVSHFTIQDGLPGEAVSSIVQTPDGTLWVGTSKGLARVDGSSVLAADQREGIPSEPIQDLATSRDGGLWIATAHDLMKRTGAGLEKFPSLRFPASANVSSLFEARDGRLWIGFDHAGVASLSNGQLTWFGTAQGLPADAVSRVFEDRDRNLWVGLFEGGTAELRKGSFRTFGKREGLSEEMTWTVLRARDGSIWVGTDSKGVDHIESSGKVHAFGQHEGLPGGSVFALYEDTDRSIWVGTEHGELSHLKNGRITVFRDPENKGGRLNAILPASNGDLLLGYHETNGLVRFHQGAFQHYSFPGLLNTATLAPDGSVWVGTDHGGVSHLENGKVTTYTARDGLLSNFAQAVYVDRDGVVWVGTSPGGLNRIENGRITTYSISQGLYDLTVGAIVEDDEGYLWMTCNKGIYKVAKKELNDFARKRRSSIQSIVYTTVDGLRSAECNFAGNPAVWKDPGGDLWFVTTAGIAGIDPAHSQKITIVPSLLVEQLSFNQKVLQPGPEVTAGPGDGKLEIQYTAPDFADPERLQFRYRLNGFESDWVDGGSLRQAIYTKLPPGSYVFELQASDGITGWGGRVATQSIVIRPFFWQTGWFRAFVGLVILVAGGAGYRLRVRYLVDRARQLEDMVGRRTAELEAAVKEATTAQRALRDQAQKDGLTGLWNRRMLFEKIESEISRAKRDGIEISVLMADVDHFKVVNDTHGHLVGDEVLSEVARMIMARIRSYDFVGRYGGEEFLIVLPGCSIDNSQRRAEDFRRAIAESPIPTAAGPLHVTCSIGVASDHGELPSEELIRRADEALYRAKRAGRNCVRIQGEALAESEHADASPPSIHP
jgi:diguanylate cyclase (GGDEF)-like protein